MGDYKFSSSLLFRNLPLNSVAALKTDLSPREILCRARISERPVKHRLPVPLFHRQLKIKMASLTCVLLTMFCTIFSTNGKNGKLGFSNHFSWLLQEAHQNFCSCSPFRLIKHLSLHSFSNASTSAFQVTQAASFLACSPACMPKPESLY